ncbi:MAG TPA: hypothetical protein VGT78_14675 [Rhizomicrobium sp.]|nr:hypothetical protein [Rhizomicrobium sp.]
MRTHFPQNRLSSLINRPGGTWRDEAIAEATRQVETLRDSSMDAVDALIGKLEAAAARKEQGAIEQLKEIQQLSDQIITIAGTFGLVFLVETAKRLCDLAQAFLARGKTDAEAIAVHIRAIRLFGPKGTALSDQAANSVLLELRRVLQHFEVAIPEEPSDALPDLEAGEEA